MGDLIRNEVACFDVLHRVSDFKIRPLRVPWYRLNLWQQNYSVGYCSGFGSSGNERNITMSLFLSEINKETKSTNLKTLDMVYVRFRLGTEFTLLSTHLYVYTIRKRLRE